MPTNTVGLDKTAMRVEIRGKRKFSSDPRLDWCFEDRMEVKRKAEQAQREHQERERKGLDEDNAKMLQKRKGGGGSAGGVSSDDLISSPRI